MNLFNTKKYRLKWERKLEERYEQGKKDAVEEALISIDKSTEDKEKWIRLSEKELLIEIMNTLNLHNIRLANLNDKINYISDYHTLFKEIDSKIKELNECENLLHKNIENSKEQVAKIDENTNQIIIKVAKINETLEKTIEIKQKIENIINAFNKVIPDLKSTCIQINDIESKMNNIIEEYSDSPMTILNNLKDNNEDIIDSIESMQNSIYNLKEIIENEFDESNYDSLHSILEDIKSKVDSSLDEFGYNSLYSKIDSIKDD